jgi:hypothetical protein
LKAQAPQGPTGLFQLSVALLVVQTESGGLGCLLQMLGGTVFQGLLMGILVAFILPLMLGAPTAAPMAALSQYKSILMAAHENGCYRYCGCDSTLHRSRGRPVHCGFAGHPGVIIFSLLSEDFVDVLLKRVNSGIQVYPDLLQSLGFLLTSGVLARAMMIGLVIIAVRPKADSEHSPILTVAGMALGSIGGVLPLFMYTS